VRARGGIVVVIAHRTSALSAVNKVLMIQNGQQVAFGDRDDVLSGLAVLDRPAANQKAFSHAI
jgi:ABC-type protease/lipase transport system fused ATPase/permease subunit